MLFGSQAPAGSRTASVAGASHGTASAARLGGKHIPSFSGLKQSGSIAGVSLRVLGIGEPARRPGIWSLGAEELPQLRGALRSAGRSLAPLRHVYRRVWRP
jgi:hypothetical protein